MNKDFLLKLARYADNQPTNKGDLYILRKITAIKLIIAELEARQWEL